MKAVRDDGGLSFCANKVWYIWVEPQLKQLVGLDAQKQDALLRSTEAYSLARENLYRLLPNCRNCICVPW